MRCIYLCTICTPITPPPHSGPPKRDEYLFSIFIHCLTKDKKVSYWLLIKKLTHRHTRILRHLLVIGELLVACSASGQIS